MSASPAGRPPDDAPPTAEDPARVTLRRRRNATVVFFLLYAVAVTWPGAVPFNRVRPLVLGLPFSLAWPAFWIVAGCGVLFLLNRAWERAETEREEPTERV